MLFSIKIIVIDQIDPDFSRKDKELQLNEQFFTNQAAK